MAEYRTTDIDNGSKVKFLLGTQEALKPYIAGTTSAVNGTFYLTNDTHRLYVGNNEGKAVPVNEGVTTVQNLTLLESTYSSIAYPGEFFYVTDGNILCVCAGLDSAGKKHFVQINNNTDTFVKSATTTITAAESVATLTQKFVYGGGSGDFTDTFQIAAAGGISVSVDGTKVTLTGTTNKGLGFSVVSDSVAATATATLKLTDSKNNTITTDIKSANSNLLNLTTDTDGKVLTLTPKDQSITGIDVSAAETGFKTTITNWDGDEVSDTIDPQITYGSNKQSTVSFTNGIATLDVYTKGEVDALERAINAMTYKGLTRSDTYTGSDINDIPAWSTIVNNNGTTKIGDTYLFVDNIEVSQTGSSENGETYAKGTLAIAKTSTNGENSNGYLTGTIDWDYVQSTVDTDTTYKFLVDTTSKKVQLISNVDGSAKGSITFADGTLTTAAVTSADDGQSATVKFNHNTVTRENTTTTATQDVATPSSLAATTNVTIVDGVTTDAYGHITAVNTKTVALKDTTSKITDFTGSVAVSDKIATLSSSIKTEYGSSNEDTITKDLYKITSDTLSLTASNNQLTVELEWGSF